MKKLLVLIAGLSLTLAACSGDDSAESSEDRETINVGTTAQSYPNSYEEDGELVGYDVEVVEHIAENLGYEVEWVTADFTGIMGQLEAGRVDTIANAVALTEEREEAYIFTEPYSFVGSQIVTRTDNDDVNSLEDLEGLEVAGVLGSNHTKVLEAYNEDSDHQFNISTYEHREGAMNDLELSRIDGYVNSTSVLLAEMNNRGLEIKFVGDPIGLESTNFPFNEGEEELRDEFDTELQKLKDDGTLVELSEKYFGEDTTEPLGEEE
ncbi:transporter substrate-binding domain-containing protein [Corticicoccus populi]|uniref:Transporter substrate-binding domain-containing protein n=1 Tax=Corticicoccus populi TaxID=1812821 RepID=A0ABW5X0Y6_9STAP